MSDRNPEYDFKWCPGCGDFGVRRALEQAMEKYIIETEVPVETNVVVAGIGCSGNMVHLLEGPQPYGFHGIHGRTLPVAMGIKMSRPELNVVVTAGDGDFLGIGFEHVGPQAARNLDVTAIVMDNGVYGLTKGQSSPTTGMGVVTSSTPYGKVEAPVNPLPLYLTMGVSYVASAMSTKIKDMAGLIFDAMMHPGFSIVHVQSPCTEYNDTYELLKGNAKKGIEPVAWSIPDKHDPEDLDAAFKVATSGGIPMGLLYRDTERLTFDKQKSKLAEKAVVQTAEELIASYAI
ncbi:MAG: thiamine pyrophosphate-dependent enzyme [Chloroflexi bacterium]|nr:thiamine pyrophosphate-dependent enzyme [Chloroflexota bacterium]